MHMEHVAATGSAHGEHHLAPPCATLSMRSTLILTLVDSHALQAAGRMASLPERVSQPPLDRPGTLDHGLPASPSRRGHPARGPIHRRAIPQPHLAALEPGRFLSVRSQQGPFYPPLPMPTSHISHVVPSRTTAVQLSNHTLLHCNRGLMSQCSCSEAPSIHTSQRQPHHRPLACGSQ